MRDVESDSDAVADADRDRVALHVDADRHRPTRSDSQTLPLDTQPLLTVSDSPVTVNAPLHKTLSALRVSADKNKADMFPDFEFAGPAGAARRSRQHRRIPIWIC